MHRLPVHLGWQDRRLLLVLLRLNEAGRRRVGRDAGWLEQRVLPVGQQHDLRLRLLRGLLLLLRLLLGHRHVLRLLDAAQRAGRPVQHVPGHVRGARARARVAGAARIEGGVHGLVRRHLRRRHEGVPGRAAAPAAQERRRLRRRRLPCLLQHLPVLHEGVLLLRGLRLLPLPRRGPGAVELRRRRRRAVRRQRAVRRCRPNRVRRHAAVGLLRLHRRALRMERVVLLRRCEGARHEYGLLLLLRLARRLLLI
mmetsp:Transcript_43342/g.133888  ORF Transcript_43342/g.133888 Transcript_43342/m.133888 type:complete len:253 (-) Transcript_43342:758-1516(-)